MNNKHIIYFILFISLLYNIKKNKIIEHQTKEKCKEINTENCSTKKIMTDMCKKRVIKDRYVHLNNCRPLCKDQSVIDELCYTDDIKKKIITEENCRKYSKDIKEGKEYIFNNMHYYSNETLKTAKYYFRFYKINNEDAIIDDRSINPRGIKNTNIYKIKERNKGWRVGNDFIKESKPDDKNKHAQHIILYVYEDEKHLYYKIINLHSFTVLGCWKDDCSQKTELQNGGFNRLEHKYGHQTWYIKKEDFYSDDETDDTTDDKSDDNSSD